MSLVFVDLETGGLKLTHPIIQIAAIAMSDDLREELGVFERLLRFREEDADPESLAINHYKPKRWKKSAIAPKAALRDLQQFLEIHASVEKVSKKTGDKYRVARLAGYNVEFDTTRLRRAFRLARLAFPADHLALDVMQLVGWNRFRLEGASGEDRKMALTAIAAEFGLSTRNAHDAMRDVRMTIEVARLILLKRGKDSW